MAIEYYARPNEAGDFSEWWGKGGAELWDELDPECLTEPETDPGCKRGAWDMEPPPKTEIVWEHWPIFDELLSEVGPFATPLIGEWDARARAIPGYSRPDDGQTAIVFRQAKGEGKKPVEL